MNLFTNSCTTLVGGVELFNARFLNALKALFFSLMLLLWGGSFAKAQSDSTVSASTSTEIRSNDSDGGDSGDDSDGDDSSDDDGDDDDGDDSSDDDGDDDDGDDDDDDNGANDVAICHQLGNGGSITIYVNENAVQAHLNHGDYLGVCDDGGNYEEPCVLVLHVLCPQDVTVECGQEGNFDATGTPEISGEFCLEELHVNFEDAVLSCGPCGKVISRTWIISLGDIVEVCTQIITSQDTQGPAIIGLESEINVQCLEGIPAFQEVSVVDACSGDGSIQNWSSQTGTIQSECVASTAFGPGADWAVWLPTLSSASGANFVFNADGGHFDQFADGSAHLYGTVVNTVNASEAFIVDLWFENKADWASWSGAGRNYKNDLLLSCATDNHEAWSYYELVGGFSTLTGAGALEGTELYIYHMPVSYYFGFQIGVGANNKNCANGMSGWFTYEGFMGAQAISGHGDVNVDLACEDINLSNCIHNTSFTYFYRGVDGCGHASIASQQINVNDTTAPVFSNCPESFTMECSDPAAPVAEGIEAIDNCSGDVVIAYLGEVAEGDACLTTLTRTWSATDICGNRANCVQVITVVDTTAPVLSNLPDGEITVECDAVPTAASVSIADNCDLNPTLVYNEERIDGNCPSNYTLVRTWYGYDQCQNNSSTYTQTIHVQDTTAPTFDAYEFYAHIECDQIPALITASDNCGEATVVVVEEVLNSGGCLGVLYRVYRATDECGNTSEAQQFISIMDTTAPEFVGLPEENTVECSEVVLNNDGGVTGSDNCGYDVVVTYSEQYVGQDDACPETYDIIRTWVATDYCENQATATRTTHVEDTTAPEFVNFPADMTISCDDEIPAVVYPTVVDNCDSNVDIALGEDMMPGSCPQHYTIYRTFRAYDNCMNERVETQTITVIDETAPVFGEQGNDFTYECNTEIPVITPVASDNCGSVSLTYTDLAPAEAISCGDFKTYFARNWGKASHEAGQYLSANFNSAFPSGITVGCGENTLYFTSAAAVIRYLPVSGQPAVLAGGDIDPNPSPNGLANQTIAATINVTMDMFDSSFSASEFQTGNLIYNVGPFAGMTVNQVIALANSHLGGCSSEYSLYSLRSALWQFNSAFTGQNSSSGLFNCGQIQSSPCDQIIVRTWTATDECENTSMFSQNIHIVDTTAPVIAGELQIDRPCDDYEGTFVSVSDNCNNWMIDFEDEMVSGSCAGNVIRHYTATDICGNVSAEFAQIIHLTDVVSPVITFVTENFSVECGSEYGVEAASFSDNCDMELDITSDFSSETDGCTTVETYTWTATDHCNNSTTATTVVTIVDTTDPYFTSLPENVTVNCDETIPGFGAYAAADNCDSDVTISVEESRIDGNCPQTYTMERTYRATDNCGNEAVETRFVYVVDQYAPSFEEQVASFTYECGEEIAVVEPIANDNCSEFSLNYTDSGLNGNSCEGVITRTWTATDECGNSSTFNQFITIVDTQAPVVNEYDNTIDMPCDAVSNEIMISAEDCNEVIITFEDQYVSGGCAGKIIRTYSVSDACGNVTTGLIQQIITLIDVTAPTVEVAPADVTIECGEEMPSYSPVWSDNCADELNVSAASSTSADACTTIISQSWTAADPCGNSTTVSRTITIIDSTAPVFTFAPSNEERDCNATDVVATATADDNCSDVTITHNDVIVGGLCAASYSIERTYTATDVCGNFVTYTQVINVSDNNGPVWGENQSSFVYECGSEAGVVTPVASDDCSEFTVSYADGNSFEYGCTTAFERTWLAVDACGNSSIAFVQYISFEDTTEPVLNGCPSDLVLNCNDEVPAAAEVTAIDGCDSDVQVNYQEIIIGDAPAEGSIADCNLITPARAAGNPCGYPYDWAMAMFNMPSAHRWYEVVGGSLVQYPGGSMHLVAQLENVLTPGTGWNVDVWFNGGLDWAAWSTQGFPTSFKADCGGNDDNFASWTYFLLQAGPGAELNGYGNYAGSVINLVHAPSNNYFGFQLGDGANNYNNAENGFGGWFSYSGSFRANAEQNFSSVSGAGDFAFELDCCPDYTIVRQWTAMDCSGNTSTCSQTISFNADVDSNDGNDGQSTIDTEAISNERLSSTIAVAPNPANNNTVFTFKSAYAAKTSLEVFDMTGKKVADVFMGTVEAGASYNVNFNVSDLATGVYTYRLTNGSDVKIDRLIIN